MVVVPEPAERVSGTYDHFAILLESVEMGSRFSARTTPDGADLSAALLDRREQPRAPGRAPEGPQFGRFRRTNRIALEQAAARALDDLVDQREPHGDRRIFRIALAPGLGEIALQELRVGNAVDDAAAGVRGEILGEIGQHLGRDSISQGVQILCAVSSLDLA